MLNKITSKIFRNYKPLNWITISKGNLLHNYRYLSSINKNIQVAPVLKSNAYGHGIVEVAKILEGVGAPFFCVDSLFEAYELLKASIKTKILIMGSVSPESLKTKLLPFSFAVYTKESVDTLAQFQPHAPVDIFVDTGMHREGVPLDELKHFVKYIKDKDLEIEGLMSHFGMAENTNNEITKQQIKNFRMAQSILSELDVQPKYIHIANSSGLLNNSEFGNNIGNVSRAGLVTYGIDPRGIDKNLKPVLELHSTISQVKDLKRDAYVGYVFTFKAKKDMKIAVLPLGYNDGIDRRLSNIGYVYVNNIPCEILGRVSMNITTIDISEVKNVKVGDDVVVYSLNRSYKNSIANAAKLTKTIPYDLLVHLINDTKRIIIE